MHFRENRDTSLFNVSRANWSNAANEHTPHNSASIDCTLTPEQLYRAQVCSPPYFAEEDF